MRYFRLSILFSCTVWIGIGADIATAQITTNTALQIAEGQMVVRLQGRYLTLENGKNEINLWAMPLLTAYGISSNFTVFALTPFQFRDFDAPSLPFNETTSSLGDIRLFARYYLYSENNPGQMARLAVLGGLEMPTGSTDKRANGIELPRPLQPGSGTWDPFAGLVFTRHTLAWHFDAAGTFTKNTSDEGFSPGDELIISVSNTYRLIPWKMKMKSGFVFGLFEHNIRWSGNSKLNNVSRTNANTFTWSVLPGVQYIRKKLTLEAGVDIPLVKNSNTATFERERMVIISSRINF